MQTSPATGAAAVAPTAEVRVSTIDELLARGGKLFEAHYREISRVQHLAKLRPDWHRFKQLERAGKLLVLGAWSGLELLGYSVTIIDSHLHYQDLVVATNDVFFVDASVRGRFVGREMQRETERLSRVRGARLITGHAKPGTTMERWLREIHGFRVEETIFSKEL